MRNGIKKWIGNGDWILLTLLFAFALVLVSEVHAFGYVGCPGSSKIEIAARSDDQYWLSFVNRENLQYNVPLAEVAGSGLRYGRDGTRNFINEEVAGFEALVTGPNPEDAFNINRRDAFLVTGGGAVGSSRVLQYDGAEFSNQVLNFQDLAAGPLAVPFTFVDENKTYGRFQLTVGGSTFIGFVWAQGNNPISVDLDGSGSINGDISEVVVRGGGILDIGANDGSGGGAVGSILVTLTTSERNFRDNKGPESLEFTISNRNGRVSVGNIKYLRNGVMRTPTSIPPFDLYEDSGTRNYYAATDYGVLINYYRPSTSAEELIMDYPGLGPCAMQVQPAPPEPLPLPPVVVPPPVIKPPAQIIEKPIEKPVEKPQEKPNPVEQPVVQEPIEQKEERVEQQPLPAKEEPSFWKRILNWFGNLFS